MSALNANLPLQQMIAGALERATEKLAAECAPATTGKSDKTSKTSKTGKTAKSGTTKTAELLEPDYIEKLASACDYLATHVEDIESQPSPSLIRAALDKMAAEAKTNSNIGAGKGAGSLATNKPTGGHQKYTHDKPHGEDAAASEAGAKPTSGGHGAATQLANNMEHAPGQGSGSVPTAVYPAKGPLVNIKHASVRDFYIAALQDEQEKTAAALSLPTEALRGALQGGGTGAVLGGGIGALTGRKNPETGKREHRLATAAKGALLGGGLGAGLGAGSSAVNAHVLNTELPEVAEIAAKLREGSLSNRMAGGISGLAGKAKDTGAGILDKIKNIGTLKTKPITATDVASHGLEGMVPEGIGHPMNKAASAAELARQYILAKLAGEDVMKANITSPKDASPLPGGGELTVGDAEKDFGKQPGGPTGGFGNEGRSHIQSNQAAIDTTKKDAKGPVKSQLAQVLEEPALSSKTDTKLKENLRNTGAAGVKIAAVQAFLQKIAAEGCSCNGNGECDHCSMTKAIATTKTAQMGGMGGAGGGMGGGMGGAGGMSGSGPGMGQMADAGEGADGCTCGGAGECRVCKLKAALAEAKMQAGMGQGSDMSQPTAPDTNPSAVKDL